MGYVQNRPVARADGSLSIRYVGGSLCHKGTELESHRSTRINFFCSTVQVRFALPPDSLTRGMPHFRNLKFKF